MSKSFEKAVEDVKILKQRPNYNQLAELYGLFKQAMVGNVNTERPGMFNVEARAKWDAWQKKKGLSTEEAKAAYVDLVEELKKIYGF